MSEGRLQQRLGLEWGSLLELPFGGLLLEGGIGQGLGLAWGSCMSQIRGLRSLCIHSFNIIDGPWL